SSDLAPPPKPVTSPMPRGSMLRPAGRTTPTNPRVPIAKSAVVNNVFRHERVGRSTCKLVILGLLVRPDGVRPPLAKPSCSRIARASDATVRGMSPLVAICCGEPDGGAALALARLLRQLFTVILGRLRW